MESGVAVGRGGSGTRAVAARTISLFGPTIRMFALVVPGGRTVTSGQIMSAAGVEPCIGLTLSHLGRSITEKLLGVFALIWIVCAGTGAPIRSGVKVTEVGSAAIACAATLNATGTVTCSFVSSEVMITDPL